MAYNKTNGTYNNIEDISTDNLLKMLQMPNYQSDDYQKMIKDELKFRKFVGNISPDLDFRIEVKNSRGEQERVAVPMTAQFFWPDSRL